jgi:hypothetical protein
LQLINADVTVAAEGSSWPSIVIMEVIQVRFNTKYVMVTAASYAAIVGRNSDDVVLCRVIAANLGKEERGFFPGLLFYCQSPQVVTTPNFHSPL